MYGRASNAKVNLSKTVLVSLSGRPHSAWVALAHAAGIQWHDALSCGAVGYLGYPLYHTDSQLSDFLNDLLVKVQRHCNLLKQRNLSIRGLNLWLTRCCCPRSIMCCVLFLVALLLSRG
ncbi:hypothetical protein BD408DRAFT_466037 [Parasitella parasitica]|nr:hypothetical protein BD408DRAFT_466037 [Parasitella parasitica]